MQSPDRFIVRPIKGKRYNNTKEIGGLEFITSTSEEDVSASNREAEVISVPLNYKGEIEKGDVLLVHHNVFKFYNDMKGRRQSGKSLLKTSSSICIKRMGSGTLMEGIVLLNLYL